MSFVTGLICACQENADHRGRDNPAPKPLKDVPCRIRTQCHQIEWPNTWPMANAAQDRKQVEKLIVLYISYVTSVDS